MKNYTKERFLNKVYIISGSHNNLNHTKRLLKSIDKQTYENSKLIFVNDGSSDETSQYIQKNFPQTTLITGNGKLWWTGVIFEGVKEALKAANQKDFILTINNDCTVEPNYLEQVISTSQQHNRAIVGSLALTHIRPTQIIDAGVKVNWQLGEFYSIQKESGKELQKNIDTLTTKGTLYPIEVFQEIGNFDKKHFPHYLSDFEFACRAKKAGYQLILDYNAIVYNDVKKTGLGEFPDKSDLKPPNILKLLFSKKSKLNIIDHINFIRIHVPRKYQLKSYLHLLKKIFKRFFQSLKKI